MTGRSRAEDSDYRAEARRVRAEAQAALRALRAARGGGRRMAEVEFPPPPPSLVVSSKAASLTRRSTPGPEHTEAERDESIVQVQEPEAEAHIHEEITENPDADGSLDPDPEEAQEVTPCDADPQSEPADQEEPATQKCDLDALPGAGPGLIWMLQEAGISSLEELSAADADELRIALGVVGTLLNVEAWIEEAGRMAS